MEFQAIKTTYMHILPLWKQGQHNRSLPPDPSTPPGFGAEQPKEWTAVWHRAHL